MPQHDHPPRPERAANDRSLVFSALAESMSDTTSVVEILQRVLGAAGALVPTADLVGVSLADAEGGFHSPVRGGPLVERLDELQRRFGDGPCVAATRATGPGIVYSPDVHADPLLGRWGPAAARAGVHAALAVGLFPHSAPPRAGALTFYSHRAHGLDSADRDVAVILAAHVGAALVMARATSAAEARSAHLETALATRDVIGQAKGILMERQGIGADEAFAMLRSASQRMNVKLTDVAQTLVDRRRDR
ncbi:GAF and ANTAR domain-containing protein [Pseudonocardia sp. WMMC193]|uniref:GAF and ANTAR domain-containing protein n=1 Tax=Pseudonocardia sp. WMMC193 TaxID=2911965 RepID=UPI001F1EFF0A|nr:GAF and ANTAR domain-containing protein [Pseudonocardia sp. WMMC193]MCF7553043.1 GAF and ANTAR domain-containing protein [Pseudonocardia sp. WMMC193]